MNPMERKTKQKGVARNSAGKVRQKETMLITRDKSKKHPVKKEAKGVNRLQGKELELTITGLGSSGEGVGRYEGMAVFVPGALPQETVKARAVFVKKNYINGELTEVLSASPERVEPVCPVYKECGGCQLQHLSYEGELKEKRQQVIDALDICMALKCCRRLLQKVPCTIGTKCSSRSPVIKGLCKSVALPKIPTGSLM